MNLEASEKRLSVKNREEIEKEKNPNSYLTAP